MAHKDARNQWRWPVHGRRTRMVVALIGLLLSLGVPVAVLSVPVPTVDGHAVGSLEDPAGLGVTGALPGNPLPTEAVPTATPSVAPVNVPADPAGAGIPTPSNLLDGPLGIPGTVFDAYQFAERTLTAIRPGCHLSWSVLAGIGRIESGHASDGRVDAFGNTLGPILGPRLDGSPGMAAVPDTDHGQLDGDTVWDRAVGPMQFIPASWRAYGVDGNGDGVANPNNIYDATVSTGLYLCAGGADLADPAQLQAAVFRYNHSAAYVNVVLQWAQAYLTGAVLTPSAPGPVPPGINGNGGRLTVPDAVSLAAAMAQPTPLAAPPATTAPPAPSSPAPPTTTTTLPPTTTTAPPTTTTAPIPTATTAPVTPTTPPVTTTAPASTTPPPATGSSPPLPPTPTPTVTPEPASGLPSPSPLATP
ncbi:MAG: lytic transglycosylase domain-containing protein [Pseudonocardiaceae bacterium]